MTGNTPRTLPRSVLDAADVSAITQLVLRERFGRDLGLWVQMRDCYHDDAEIRISWFQGDADAFVERSKVMAARNLPVSHRLGPIQATVNGNRAIAHFAAIIDAPLFLDGVEMMLASHTRLLLRAEKRQDRWRLSGFDAIYLRDEIAPAILGQTVVVDPAALDGFRPSYRFLAYCLSAGGFPVRDDLPGTDRPALVAALTDEIYGWLGLPAPV